MISMDQFLTIGGNMSLSFIKSLSLFFGQS